MNNLMNLIVTKTWRSDYFRSWVLAQARIAGMGLGSWMVLHGFGNETMAQQVAGFVVAAAMFYLQNLDVKIVDGKIKVALMTPAPTEPVESAPLPPVEAKK